MSAKEEKAISLKIDKVGKHFGDQEVLSDVSFEVKPGEIFVLMGPSGSGKSVLLRLIAGLNKPTAGKIFIKGMPVQEAKSKGIVSALVFQAGALFNSMSVFDNLALYPREHRVYNEKTISEKVMHILEILSLADAANKMPSELSGGMKKRVAIARGLIMEPDFFLYDEPTSELDPVTGASIIEVMGYVSKKFDVTTLIVSHDNRVASAIGDRVGLLEYGKLLKVDYAKDFERSEEQYVREFLQPNINLKEPKFLRIKNEY